MSEKETKQTTFLFWDKNQKKLSWFYKELEDPSLENPDGKTG